MGQILYLNLDVHLLTFLYEHQFLMNRKVLTFKTFKIFIASLITSVGKILCSPLELMYLLIFLHG